MNKVNKGKGCFKFFIIIIVMAIGIPMLVSAINKPTKGETVNQSISNFLGAFDETKETTSGATRILDKGNGVFMVTYNFFPVSAENTKDILEEVGNSLTDDLKALLKADARIKKIQLNLKTPYTVDGKTIHKQLKNFEIDSKILNNIDKKSRLLFDAGVID